MERVSEMVSSSIGDYLTNRKAWGPVMYNVLENKLVGDGVTDDTAALQTLVNKAIEAGRKAIFFPHTPSGGQYYVTSLTNADQVMFFGDNSSFVGGYSGVIRQLGDLATNEQFADITKRTDQPFVGRQKTVKEDAGYNLWPVIVRTLTNRIIVFYGSGTKHIMGEDLGRALCYKYSDSDGLQWSDEVVMLQDPSFDYTTFSACALADGSVICIANKYTPTVRVYKVMKSTNNGVSFSEVFDFSNSTQASIKAAGYPNVPVEMDNGEIIASKQSNMSGLFGLYFIFSSDGGVTWNKSVEAVAPIHASVVTMPWEVRIAYVGGGRLLAIGRNNQGNPYQLTSTDYGMTWDIALTNIDDCVSHNLFPVYIVPDDAIALYYTDRQSNTILKRVVPVSRIFNSPTSWPLSEIIDYTSSPSTAIDSGYPTAVTTRPNGRDVVMSIYTTRGVAAPDDTTPRNTGVVTVYDKARFSTANSPTYGLYRQALINGDFDRWIRGTSFTATGYTADRWRLIVSSGATITVTREAFVTGQTVVPNEPTYCLQFAISIVGSGTSFLNQRIEDVKSFAGQRIYYSFYAKTISGTYYMSVYAGQNFGSSGSSAVSTDSKTHKITGVWNRYEGFIDVPSILGKTTGVNSYLELVFRFPTSSGVGTIQLSQAQVNVGGRSLPFNRRHEAEELMLCERYAIAYTSSGTNNPIGNGFAISTTQARIQLHFPTSMRTLPSLIAIPGEWQLSDGVTTTDVTAISIIAAQNSDKTVTLLVSVASGLTQFRPYHLIADGTANRILIFDAEY